MDHLSIRAAQLRVDGRGGASIERLEEIRGNFAEDGDLLQGLRQLKDKLGSNQKVSVVSCLSGKQVFASQLEFRHLPPEEMEQALRLELRKTVHFEVATSVLDYQFLSDEDGIGGTAQIVVALAANSLLTRQTSLLEKAGIKPSAVDVLPLAVSNAMWAVKGSEPGSSPMVALHIGPQISTVVIDGEESQFFNRTIYFAAEDMFAETANPKDREKRLKDLAQEVARSLAYYEKGTFSSSIREIVLLGEYLDQPGISEHLRVDAGITSSRMNLASQLGYSGNVEAGRFDLAIALALRGDV